MIESLFVLLVLFFALLSHLCWVRNTGRKLASEVKEMNRKIKRKNNKKAVEEIVIEGSRSNELDLKFARNLDNSINYWVCDFDNGRSIKLEKPKCSKP